MTGMQERIEAKLRESLTPERVTVIDDSHLHAGHAGHAGARPGGDSHFTVEIVSDRFAGLNRVARHRLVNAALAEELAGPVHALVIRARAPGE